MTPRRTNRRWVLSVCLALLIFESEAEAAVSEDQKRIAALLDRPGGDPWGFHAAWACPSSVGTPRRRARVLEVHPPTRKVSGIRGAALIKKRAKRLLPPRHPQGWGTTFGRPRAFSSLDPEVETLLHRHIPLHLLRHDEPASFLVHGLQIGDHFALTSLDSGLTPYGWVGEVEARWQWTLPSLLGRASLGVSDEKVYPGLWAELRTLPLGPIDLGAAFALWTQPEGLRWGGPPTPGGSLELRVLRPMSDRVTLWAGGHGKTEGWERGLVEHHAAFVARAGLTGWFGDLAESPY